MVDSVDVCFERAKSLLKVAGIELFDYQEEGVRWMLEHELNPDGNFKTHGGLLCDDPGLGKTLQTIALMLANPVAKTLIVVPISLMEQWRDQIRKAWPDCKIRINALAGVVDSYKEINKDFNVLISGYSRVWDTDMSSVYQKTILHTIQWGRVIIDECHTIRNKKSKVFAGCHDLRAKYRWGLSGTPIQNKLDDLKTLFRYIHLPETLIINNIDDLIRNYIKRRNKSLVADKYKDLKINILDIPFDTDAERDFYVKVKDEVKREYLRLIHEEDQSSLMMEIFELILRLRQATIHPNLVIKGLAKKFQIRQPKLWKGPSTKINKLLEQVANQEDDDKALIVCHFREEIDQARLYLGKAFPHLRMEVFDGGLSLSARNEIVAKSMRGEVDVLFMQIMAGGVGLNLQVFNKVYMLTPNWNPGNEIQAFARCHRIGQTRDVEVFKFMIKDEKLENISTIDERIIAIQQDKRTIMSSSLNDDSLQFNEHFNFNPNLKTGLTLKDIKKLLM